MTSRTSAADVSARIETLIARHHGGNARVAAATIGIAPEKLAGLLSGDWRLFSLDALASLVREHALSVDWLLRPVTANNIRRTGGA
jgi:hypothetical protein